MRSEQLEGIIAMFRSAGSRGASEMTVEEWRAAYAALGALLPARAGVPVEPVDAGGVAAEWIGDDADGPVVVYLHGGGYCIGSIDTHRPMLTHLAAGVGLTIATLVALRDAGEPLPAAGVCLSPWVDLTQSGDSVKTRAEADPMVRGVDLDRWASAYAGSADARRPAVSPLFADLAGLPPLLIEVGTAEVLLDDARRLAAKASGDGVDVTFHEEDDLIHVWHFFAGAVPEADEGIDRVAAFIRAHAGAPTR